MSQPNTTDRYTVTERSLDAILGRWPRQPRRAAERIVDEYGRPDEAMPSRLVWFDNGPWKRTVVRRDGARHDFPKPHADYVEQVVDYAVPPEHVEELTRFDGSVTVRRTRGELSAECQGEPANFLALNLAHDIVAGDKTVEKAREDYGLITAKKQAGGSPEYTEGLQFEIPEGDQGDPDRTVVTDEMIEKAEQLVEQ